MDKTTAFIVFSVALGLGHLAPVGAAKKPAAKTEAAKSSRASEIAQCIEVFRGSDYSAMDVAIAQLAARGAKAVPALNVALTDSHKMVRSQSAAALTKMGAKASPAVANLIALLKDADRDARWNAVRALAAIGKPARGAVPMLKEMLKSVGTEPYERLIRDEAIKAVLILDTP